MADVLGVAPATTLGHFTVLAFGETSLDFLPAEGEVTSRHFAFLVSETEFDEIFERLKDRKVTFWADPFRSEPGRFNRWDDGRGVYFDSPEGHLLEIITRPYGSGGCEAEHPNPLLDC